MAKFPITRFIEEYRRNGGNVTQVCKILGVKRDTFYNNLKNNKSFEDKIKAIDIEFTEVVKSKLLKLAVTEDNLGAMKYYLDKFGISPQEKTLNLEDIKIDNPFE